MEASISIKSNNRSSPLLRDNRTTREADTNRNMVNRKPYRTKELKEEGRRTAVKVDGTYVSDAQVLYHSKPKAQP
jgi:hypothetical protein